MDYRPKYDASERERIRRDLLSYKLKYGIGAPRLALLISEAVPRGRDIDQRRVSRFLGREHESEDEFIGWCDIFLKTVPETRDAVFRLAQGLTSFYDQKGEHDFSGTYAVRTPRKGELEITGNMEIAPDKDFWRIDGRTNDRKIHWQGALIGTSMAGVAVLVDKLTGTPRLCTLDVTDTRIVGYPTLVPKSPITYEEKFELERVDGGRKV